MRSNNPVFNRSEAFSNGGYATFDTASAQQTSTQQLEDMYAAPAATSVQMGRMTLDDVVMKTAAQFGVLIVFAAIGWQLAGQSALMWVPWVAMFVALGIGLVISFKQSTNPALILSYAAVEGLFVGGISKWYQDFADDNIVGLAVLGTLAAFAGMLVLYRSGKLRATPKFTKMLITAGFGYLILSLASLVSAIFGVGDGWGFFGLGGLGVLLCLAGVALASFFLILDFDFIEQGIANGAPERTAWLAGFGLLVTLVWLYLEILRLLAILRGD
jgi:uncharacterized YccA/Bax inhibitor family protein